MELRFYTLPPRLAPYVAHLWTVESDESFQPEDLRAILPNARMKLVFPFKGALINSPGDRDFQINPENTLWVLGLSDRPWTVDHHGAFGTLAAEFHPGGAYRFFRLTLASLRNLVVPAVDIFGPLALEWEDRLATLPVPQKIEFFCQILMSLLDRGPASDVLVDEAVGIIQRRKGLISIRELAEFLGYSPRYVGAKFESQVGLSPKMIAEILRFQNKLSFLTRFDPRNATFDFDGYYDQAHGIKEFKRFSGRTPGLYSRARNEFYNRFQQETGRGF